MVELDIKLVVLHCKTKLWQNATPEHKKEYCVENYTEKRKCLHPGEGMRSGIIRDVAQLKHLILYLSEYSVSSKLCTFSQSFCRVKA